MLKGIIVGIRRILQKMGLVKNVKEISSLKSIPVDDGFYDLISQWKSQYKGYDEKMHKISDFSIAKTKSRRMHTLKMPKVVSQEMASLIFNERCEINIDNEDLKENIDDIFKNNRFMFNTQKHLEFMFALGGMVIKPYYDNETQKIMLTYVTADCFIPVAWNNRGIQEGVFIDETRKGKVKYTLLEWHVWEDKTYIIRNELYKAENTSELGKEVPLNTLYPELDEKVPIKGLKKPCFVYLKPNIANNIDIHSALGIPLTANSFDTLKSLDTAFDSFEREFRLGKRRIIVPTSAVRTVIDSDGNPVRYFDPNDEVYQAMDIGTDDNNKIQDNTVELRVDEHISAINALLNLLATQSGFSVGSFSFDGKSVKTATEVVSENSKTFKSKQSHENIIGDGIVELIELIIELAELYDVFERPKEDYEITIKFDDSVVEDRKADLEKAIAESINSLKPQYKIIAEYNKISEKEAKQWLKEIRQEESENSPTQQELEAEGALFGSQE